MPESRQGRLPRLANDVKARRSIGEGDKMSTVNSNDSGKPSERPTDFNALLELFDEITGSVPEESWEKMPPDLSKNIDHFLYGCPKKKE